MTAVSRKWKKPGRSAQDYLEEKTSIQERLKDVKREWAERKTPDKPAPQKKPPELGDL